MRRVLLLRVRLLRLLSPSLVVLLVLLMLLCLHCGPIQCHIGRRGLRAGLRRRPCLI